MQKIIYGFIDDEDDENAGNMLLFTSIDEIDREVGDIEEGKVFIFELKDEGRISIDRKMTFKSSKRGSKKAK